MQLADAQTFAGRPSSHRGRHPAGVVPKNAAVAVAQRAADGAAEPRCHTVEAGHADLCRYGQTASSAGTLIAESSQETAFSSLAITQANSCRFGRA